MSDKLLEIYEDMYGSKNTVQQVEEATHTKINPIKEDLRRSEDMHARIIEDYTASASGYPTNKPSKAQDATKHIPEEIKPAIETEEDLSPAIDSSTSKKKLTKTITDKEKKQMTSHKFSFDQLYKTALREQLEGGEEMMDIGEEGDIEGDLGLDDIDGMGEGEEITITLDKELAQTLCDLIQGALGDGDDMEDSEIEDDGDPMADAFGDDELEETTEMSPAKQAARGQADRKNQKVMSPETANKDLNFTKANINPNQHTKVATPQKLSRKTTDQNSGR